MNYVGTCSTNVPQKPLTLEDLERTADLIGKMPPEPIGEWMRSIGRPPEEWVLFIPMNMTDSLSPILPSYVRVSSFIENPVLMTKTAVYGN